MSVTYWTLRCRVCGQQMIAERPDTDYTCDQCGTVQLGVSGARARTLERVTTGSDEFLRHKGVFPEYGNSFPSVGSALSSMLRRAMVRWSGRPARDGGQSAVGTARMDPVPAAVVVTLP